MIITLTLKELVEEVEVFYQKQNKLKFEFLGRHEWEDKNLMTTQEETNETVLVDRHSVILQIRRESGELVFPKWLILA